MPDFAPPGGPAGAAAAPAVQQPEGFAIPTPAGVAIILVAIAFAIFFYSTPSPGPRVGRVRAILGPRPRPGAAS
ncbi:MAG TPA: hypothetical protein GXX28_11665 [Firmicutes bacterium]|nr:hypothetical protein [Bacillota bacterium]